MQKTLAVIFENGVEYFATFGKDDPIMIHKEVRALCWKVGLSFDKVVSIKIIEKAERVLWSVDLTHTV